MEEDLRSGLSSNPRAALIWHEDRAAALVAVGRSDDTVLEAFRQKWALMGDDRSKGVEPVDRALLATARGRFADAAVFLANGEKAIVDDPNAAVHSRYAELRIAIDQELGRPRDAAKVAESYMAKKDLWVGASASLQTVPMLRVMEHGGLLGRDEFVKQRDAWYAQARAAEADRWSTWSWALAFANFVETPAEAKDALAALPLSKDGTPDFRLRKDVFSRAELGNVLLLSGHAADAIPNLENAANACNWLQWPVQHTRALLHLGQAREEVGDTSGACVAYRAVVARWGNAPRSVTRDAAKARMKALSCAAASPPKRDGGASDRSSAAGPTSDADDESGLLPPMPPDTP
jgi:hypothetical protein